MLCRTCLHASFVLLQPAFACKFHKDCSIGTSVRTWISTRSRCMQKHTVLLIKALLHLGFQRGQHGPHETTKFRTRRVIGYREWFALGLVTIGQHLLTGLERE
ncbi:uncharacterized protein MEPE_02441 [Melanopsichium pennsylvanicum]|uniref:Secreted protein n=1 Tax=Melanopsichium pennsylvanicum TaxID=63383 RepID=A0AAJ4XJY2_9BASI|nr:uncharacterized protein MEPE_02441 [Melanopsichium pennsylvanicum]